MMKSRLDPNPEATFVTMAVSDFHTQLDATDKPAETLMELSESPKPMPYAVINADPDRGKFVVRTKSMREPSNVNETFP
jgi:hypothetical protein